MSNRKISIVTPSFNQGQYIEQTIQSVLDQGYPNLEYIIIDGGSTDDSVSIIKKYEKYLKYWVSEPDRGQTDAINKGFNESTGAIFNWLNSDDYYEDHTLKRVNEYFSDDEVDIVLGRSILFKENSDWKKTAKGGHLFGEVERTIGDALFDQPSSFFRHHVFKSLSPLETEVNYLMDRLIWLRYLVSKGQQKVLKTDAEFVNFRLHEKSKTVSEISGFNQERNGIFLSLAQHLRMNDFESIIQSKLDYKNLTIEWPELKKDINKKKIFFEFLLVNAQEEYLHSNFQQAKELSLLIQKPLLSKESQNAYSLLNKKLLLPKQILKWAKTKN